ncbi:MAG: A/G-specific adenine glycosylase [Neisseriaceae bacterium]
MSFIEDKKSKVNEVFSELLVSWQKQFGRHGLPWQVNNPYWIWVSEVMLQQTQVSTVKEYFPKFIRAFPDLKSLAEAKEETVLKYWAGLGYYSRAKNLHTSARFLNTNYGQNFPSTRAEWQQLKGIGRSTAAAIVAFAFQRKEAILDGNVKRVLARLFALYIDVAQSSSQKILWELSENLLPANSEHMPAYTQGLMDLGAMVCLKKKPRCLKCPVHNLCQAYKRGQVDYFPVINRRITLKKIDYFWPLVITDSAQLMVFEREAKGIWSGLLTPPTFETKVQMLKWLKENALDTNTLVFLCTLVHKLTHRELSIHLFRLVVDSIPQINKGMFYPISELRDERVPKPFKMVLSGKYLMD